MVELSQLQTVKKDNSTFWVFDLEAPLPIHMGFPSRRAKFVIVFDLFLVRWSLMFIHSFCEIYILLNEIYVLQFIRRDFSFSNLKHIYMLFESMICSNNFECSKYYCWSPSARAVLKMLGRLKCSGFECNASMRG